MFGRFKEALGCEPPASIRLNKAKCCGLQAVGEQVPWCAEGVYLDKRPEFTFDPLLHAGCYYVQEAASMFVGHVVRQHIHTPAQVLDLCAAPGGKSTAIMAALPEGSMLVSNEPVRARANILAENICKWGCPGVIVTNNYPKDYARSGLMFDAILCDVPCSGEGMFRKDADAIGQWSIRNVENCQTLQREIVEQAWQCLKPGGLLVYSTCTFNAKENEDNVAWIVETLEAEPLSADIEDCWNISGSPVNGFPWPVYRFMPGTTRSEGLFMAVMRKPADATPGRPPKKVKPGKAEQLPAGLCRGWIANHNEFDFTARSGYILAIPRSMAKLYSAAAATLKVVHAGVCVGQIKGKDIVPEQSLALSAALNRKAFANIELPYPDAIAYLRKDSVTLPAGAPHGFVLATFRGMPIGFLKNIGNRANNLYPAEWKIKSTHIPDKTVCVVTPNI